MATLTRFIRELHEFDWRELADPGGMGSWPAAVKTTAILLLAAAVLLCGYQLRLRDLREQDAGLGFEAVKLAAELERLRTNISSLAAYRQRAREIEEPYLLMLRQLPYESETAALLEQISALGAAAGLRFSSIDLAPEQLRPHYVEQPIDIRLLGSYYGVGEFFAGVAELDRLVTLHDFSLSGSSADALELSLQARTYRYRPLPETAEGDDSAEFDLEDFPAADTAPGFSYAVDAARDPFSRAPSPPAVEVTRRQALEQYALDRLRLVGLLRSGSRFSGLIEDPSGAVHRVSVGDYLGLNRARIQQITEFGLELIEWKNQGPGEPRQSWLALESPY